MKNAIKHNGQIIDLSNLSRDELSILKSDVEFSLININNQILEAKGRAGRDREYSDPKWFRSVNDARSIYIKNLASINLALSVLKKKRIEESTKRNEGSGYPFSYYFHEAAMHHLPKDDYDYICKIAELYRDEAVRNGIKVIDTPVIDQETS